MTHSVVRPGRLYTLTRLMHGAARLTRGRGLSSIYRLMLTRVDETDRTIVRLAPDATFAYPALDYYWDLYIKSGRQYEPEILFALQRARRLRYRFVDCGANFGYWSVMVSSAALGRQAVISIEASTSTFAVLRANAQLNGERFRVLNRAVYSRSGERLSFGGGSHVGRSLTGGANEVVQTITLDDVMREWEDDSAPLPIICKLDIEGAEIEAIAGAGATLSAGAAFIYEDHGKHPACANTDMFLGLGCEVYYLAPSAVLGPIRTLDAARRVKESRFKGYNFLALTPGADAVRRALIG